MASRGDLPSSITQRRAPDFSSSATETDLGLRSGGWHTETSPVDAAPTTTERTERQSSFLETLRPVASLGDGNHTPQNVALTSFALGGVAGLGLAWSLYIFGTAVTSILGSSVPPAGTGSMFSLGPALRLLGPVFVALPLYHFLEYIVTALYNPAAVEYDSFMFSPDPDGRFSLALLASLVEFLVEVYLFPSMKLHWWTWALGLLCLVVGQTCRTLAMTTAKRSFNHYVASVREPGHVLVTSGIYRLARHPSYLGFYLWAVGLQIYLGNPICTLAYVGVLGMFFQSRIAYEEQALIRFFGADYVRYQQTTAALVPYIY
ncbi:farnesyl cysteine-carboxyl methyltransferase [Tieghemiomyces parasiticus]|uniref:Protein-S-isoprenylcysteine O-methyltransferase n=1 Tax=Tieghemiomyces parasiticus TaxID=78921 RepID=A0A9W8A7M2_9FUNG|nr:farnesyl cysteine-carboxyl methyltransferase [Tieghemiomyces parasiticus]